MSSTYKITRWTDWWIESKRDQRLSNPLLFRKVFKVFPRVASPWLNDKAAVKAWMPEEKAA